MTGGLDVLFHIMKHKKLLPHRVLTGSSGLEITSFQWFVKSKYLCCKSYYFISLAGFTPEFNVFIFPTFVLWICNFEFRCMH